MLREFPNQRRQVLRILKRGDTLQRRLERLESFLIDQPRIHAGRIESPVFLLQWSLGVF